MPAFPGIKATTAPRGVINVTPPRPVNVRSVDLDPLARTLDAVAAIENKIEQAERAAKVRSGTQQADLALARIESEFESDPDFETQAERFAERREEIREQARTAFQDDEAAFQVWQGDFNRSAMRSELAIRERATKMRRERLAAGMEIDLQNYADMAGLARDPGERERLRDEGMLAIADSLDRGLISPMEAVKRGRKFRSDIVAAQVREDIRVDPEGTEEALLSGEYTDLQGEGRVKAIELAGSRARTEADRAWRAEERIYRRNERMRNELFEKTQREGDELLTSGEMTRQWVEDNRDNMDNADYRYYLSTLSDERATATENEAYSQMYTLLSAGVDIREQAREALQRRQITRTSYNSLMSAQRIADRDKPSQNIYRRGIDMITAALEPGPMVDDPAARIRKAEAVEEWTQWNLDNPNATPEEQVDKRDLIIKQQALVNWKDVVRVGKAPRFLVGGRRAPDMAASFEATEEFYLRKHGGNEAEMLADGEYQKELELLVRWREALNAAQ